MRALSAEATLHQVSPPCGPGSALSLLSSQAKAPQGLRETCRVVEGR